MGCSPIAVDLEVITPDQTRKITFGLERDCNNDGTASWTMHFELDEASTPGSFNEVVKLDIEINQENHPKAEATAQNGLDANQTSHAFVAGDTAKAFKLGQATLDDVNSDANDVIAART